MVSMVASTMDDDPEEKREKVPAGSASVVGQAGTGSHTPYSRSVL